MAHDEETKEQLQAEIDQAELTSLNVKAEMKSAFDEFASGNIPISDLANAGAETLAVFNKEQRKAETAWRKKEQIEKEEAANPD